MIVYVGSFELPLKEAVAKRAIGLGYAFREAGYRIGFIGEDENIGKDSISGDFYYDEFLCCSLHKPDNAIERFFYKKDLLLTLDKIEEWNLKYKVDTIIFCGTRCAFYASKLINNCKKRGYKIVADTMDWLTANTGNIVFNTIKNFDSWFEMQIVNKKVDAMICISQCLAKYYSNTISNTIVVPPLSPLKKNECHENIGDQISLFYAGIPFRLGSRVRNPKDAKDRLDIIIDLLYEIAKTKTNFVLNIYGMTFEQYIQCIPIQSDKIRQMIQNKNIIFHGYADAITTRTALLASDYTVLFREDNQTSNMGFPTKIAESIYLGIPVITTDTSDILTYTTEGKDAFILDKVDLMLAQEQLKSVLNGGLEKAKIAKEYAAKNISFNPENHALGLKGFMERLNGGE